nr:metal tolerance protein 10-like [Tanacetum cinerariifolium]
KHGKVRDYYKKQECLLEGFNKMETINESGYLPDMLLNKAHNNGEMLQEKLEQLSEIKRAFVHIDFEFSHRLEHKAKFIHRSKQLPKVEQLRKFLRKNKEHHQSLERYKGTCRVESRRRVRKEHRKGTTWVYLSKEVVNLMKFQQ